MKRARWTRAWPLLLIVVGVVVALVYNASLDSRAEVGKAAPDFTLLTPDGQELSLSDLRGKPVFLHFWATWCPTCVEAVPAWQAFEERYGDRATILNVNVREGTNLIRRYHENFAAKGLELTMTVVRDQTGRVADQYLLWAIPESWGIDPNGVAREYLRGAFFFEDLQRMYELATGVPIDAGGVGPVPEGGTLYRVDFGPDGLWTATSDGLTLASEQQDSLRADETAWPELAGKTVNDISYANGAVWVAAADQGLWRYADGVWHRVQGLPAGHVLAVAAEPNEGRVIYVWIPGAGLYRSDNGGSSWRYAGTLDSRLLVQGLAVVPGQPERLFVGALQGLYESRDGGASWERKPAVERHVFDIAIERSTGRILLATDLGVMVSHDGGRTVDYLMSAPRRRLHSIALNPNDPNHLVIGAPNGDVYRSDDAGASWIWLPWS